MDLQTSKENYFKMLSAIDVSENLEKKGQFTYLSWPFAVRKLRETCPTATWVIKKHNGIPYIKTECGYFVEVEVTVNNISLSQIHPVLDNRNKTIENPTAFQINTSIQRCLVKAIALHGLGLSVYAGEDLPKNISEKTKTYSNKKTTLHFAPKKPRSAHELRGRLDENVGYGTEEATAKQKYYIQQLVTERHNANEIWKQIKDKFNTSSALEFLTKGRASYLIDWLQNYSAKDSFIGEATTKKPPSSANSKTITENQL